MKSVSSDETGRIINKIDKMCCCVLLTSFCLKNCHKLSLLNSVLGTDCTSWQRWSGFTLFSSINDKSTGFGWCFTFQFMQDILLLFADWEVNLQIPLSNVIFTKNTKRNSREGQSAQQQKRVKKIEVSFSISTNHAWHIVSVSLTYMYHLNGTKMYFEGLYKV